MQENHSNVQLNMGEQDYLEMLDEAAKEQSRLKVECEGLNKEREFLQQKRMKLEQQIDVMQQEFFDVKRANEDLAAKLHQLDHKFQEEREKQKQAAIEKNKLIAEKRQLCNEMEEMESKIEEIKGEALTSKKELQAARQEVAKKQQELKTAVQNAENWKKGSEGYEQKLRDQLKAYEEEMNRKQNRVDSLLKKESNLKSRIILMAIVTAVSLLGCLYFYSNSRGYKEKYTAEQYSHEETQQQLEEVQEAYNQIEYVNKDMEDANEKLENTYNSLQKSHEALQENYDRLTGSMEGNYGYGSENIYSDKNVLFMDVGDTETVSIYADVNAIYSLSYNYSIASASWVSDFEGVWADVTITARGRGTSVISITNDQNSDILRILVVVQ